MLNALVYILTSNVYSISGTKANLAKIAAAHTNILLYATSKIRGIEGKIRKGQKGKQNYAKANL